MYKPLFCTLEVNQTFIYKGEKYTKTSDNEGILTLNAKDESGNNHSFGPYVRVEIY